MVWSVPEGMLLGDHRMVVFAIMRWLIHIYVMIISDQSIVWLGPFQNARWC